MKTPEEMEAEKMPGVTIYAHGDKIEIKRRKSMQKMTEIIARDEEGIMIELAEGA